MDAAKFFNTLLSELFIIPALILIFTAMKHKLRYSVRQTVIRSLVVTVILLPLGALIASLIKVTPYTVLIPVLFLYYIFCIISVTANLAQITAVFLFIIDFEFVFTNLAHAVAAIFYPDGSALEITFVFAASRLMFSVIFFFIIYHSINKFLSFLVDLLDDPFFWWIRAMISAILLTLNISMAPIYYSTLHVSNVFRAFLTIQAVILLLEILLGGIFYLILLRMRTLSELEIKNNLFEMQEQAYEKQQRFLKENSRIRHDFKHTIRTIKVMTDNGNYAELRKYLDEYVRTIPENEIIPYCDSTSLNALLNYYRDQAGRADIRATYKIELPPSERNALSDTELCSIVGNILENAILAASEQKEGERYIRLTLSVQYNFDFYIVAVNSFNGQPLMKNGRYQSSGENRSGIGLRSIESTVAHHGGVANFHHEGTEFFSDIMIPAKKPEE